MFSRHRHLAFLGCLCLALALHAWDSPAETEGDKNDVKPALDRHGDPLPPGAVARLGTVRLRQTGYSGRPVALAPDGKTIVSAAESRSLSFWDPATGKLLRRIDSEDPVFAAIAYAPDGKTLAGAGRLRWAGNMPGPGALRLCDAAGKELRTFTYDGKTAPAALVFTPDGKTVLTGDSDGTLRAWDMEAGKERLRHKLSKGELRALALSPDGSLLAAAARADLSLWEWQGKGKPRVLKGLERDAEVLSFSPDGKLLVTGSDDQVGLRLWDVSNGKLLRRLTAGDRLDFVRGVAFSPDGKWLVSTHYRGTVAIWDPATGKEVRRLETGQDSVQGVVISPDSQWFAVGTETGLRVWKLATGEPVAEHGPAHRGRLTGIAFARPTEVVTSGHDGTVRFWDALTGRQRLQVTHSSWVTCAVSPDGKRLATTAHDDTVRLWDAASGKEVFRLAGHGKFGGLYRVNFAPDGERLLSWGDDFSLRVWKTANGKALLEHAIRPSGIPIPDDVDELDNPDRRELEIRQLKLGLVRGTFSPDGKWLVLHVGSNFHIFDIATGKEARKLIGGRESVLALAISPDGRLLLNGSLSAVTVRDLATGKVLKEILLGDDRANAVAFSADGRRFAFGTRRPPGKIEIWEVASLSRAHTIEGLDGTADYLAFSPDGRLLAAAMDDTSGLVWDLARTAAARTAPSKESPP